MKKIYLGVLTLLLSFTINAQTAPVTSICVVTVDTASTHNIVIWERADQTSALGIDSMYVYRRDDVTGVDEFIAAVHYDSLSEYHDMDVAADPNVKSSLYRIAGKDVTGQLGNMSDSARTIFLDYTYSGGIFTLNWNPYFAASFTDYICWDKIPGQDVNLIQGTSTTWDFSTIVTGQQYNFMIDLTNMAGCTSTKANHNTSRSNKRPGGIMLPTSIDENSIVGFNLSPNPADSELNISFDSRHMSKSKVIMYNLLGEIVLQIPTSTYFGNQKLKMDVSNLNSGLYLVTIENGIHTQNIEIL